MQLRLMFERFLIMTIFTVKIMNSVFWEDFLLPTFICVVMPVLIVLIVSMTRRKEMEKKSEIMLSAIEHGAQVDPEFFSPKVKRRVAGKTGTVKQTVYRRLHVSLVLTFIGLAVLLARLLEYDEDNGMYLVSFILIGLGIAFLISFLVGRNAFAEEIKYESQHPEQ